VSNGLTLFPAKQTKEVMFKVVCLSSFALLAAKAGYRKKNLSSLIQNLEEVEIIPRTSLIPTPSHTYQNCDTILIHLI
jgi:hypothetical protein